MQENSQNTDLLESLKSGNEKAFADIYHKYSAAILANILKLNIRRPEAEDILQDVFVELWNSRHKISPSHSIAGWLFTTSYYKSMAHLKRAIKQAIILINDNIAGTSEADNDIHAYEDNYKRQLSILSQAIEDLPNRQKQAFKLRKLEGRNHREIAIALNISESTAKDYVKSAVISLKKSIQGQNPPPELIIALLTVVNMCR